MMAMITGSSGFFGQYLMEYLKSSPELEHVVGTSRTEGLFYPTTAQKNNAVYYCNLDKPSWVETLFKKVNPDIIFHMAAEQNSSPNCYINNVLSTYNILKYCSQGCRIVLASSSTVYGDFSANYGDVANELSPLFPTSQYGASKVACEAMLNAYISAGKVTGIALRYSAIVGQNNNKGLVYSVINKLNNSEIELFGEKPGSIKPYLHVDEAAKITKYLALSKHSGVFNVCPSDAISVNKICNIIMKCKNVNKKKKWLGRSSVPVGDNCMVRMGNAKLTGQCEIPISCSYEAIKRAIK
jgi:UDP-glucose 4-epimerase